MLDGSSWASIHCQCRKRDFSMDICDFRLASFPQWTLAWAMEWHLRRCSEQVNPIAMASSLIHIAPRKHKATVSRSYTETPWKYGVRLSRLPCSTSIRHTILKLALPAIEGLRNCFCSK